MPLKEHNERWEEFRQHALPPIVKKDSGQYKAMRYAYAAGIFDLLQEMFITVSEEDGTVKEITNPEEHFLPMLARAMKEAGEVVGAQVDLNIEHIPKPGGMLQ